MLARYGVVLHMWVPPLSLLLVHLSPAGSGVQTQLALSHGIIKSGGIAWALSYAGPLWTSLRPGTVATLPSQWESPILGRLLLASPLGRLPAARAALAWFVCQDTGLKAAMRGSLVNIGFESWRKNVKMLNSIDFPPLLFVSLTKA